jgi:DNA adenine methylase
MAKTPTVDVMGYPGGKSGPGVFHRLINRIPPHSEYFEPFLGNGAVMRHKRPAGYNVGIDLDASVIRRWRSLIGLPADPPGSGGEKARPADPCRRAQWNWPAAHAPGEIAAASWRFMRGDALTFLAVYPFKPDAFIYCDPPYLMETRSSGRIYRHEFSAEQHAELLSTIVGLPCRVMISGYWSEMYAEALRGWHSFTFEAMTRGGMATEWVWCNFPEPVALHDFRYLGETSTKRQDLKRMVASWTGKLKRMPTLKKQALLSAIASAGENADADRHGGNAIGIR